MFELMWQEFTRSGKIVMRRKVFKSRDTMDRFIEKLFRKDNFWQIYGMRCGE